MPKPAIPPGYVLVHLGDFTRLATAAAAQPTRPAVTGNAPGATNVTPGRDSAVATREGISLAIALTAAELGGNRTRRSALAPEVPPDAVVAALVLLVAASLRAFLSYHGEGLLRDLGLAAARESTR